MMDNPNDSTLDRLFGEKPPAPKLVVQHQVPPAAPAGQIPQLAAGPEDDDGEPAHYRPYLSKPRPLVAFVLVEKDGTMHGFQYHTLRHPKLETIGGADYLSFSADGMAVVLEGRGLAVIFRAMTRYCLAEVREYDERPGAENVTLIRRLAVTDPRAQQA